MCTMKRLAVCSLLAALAACGADQANTSGLALLLTDAPGEFEQVPIQLKAVWAYHVGEAVADAEKAEYKKAAKQGETTQVQAGETTQAKKSGDVEGGQWVKMMIEESAQHQDLLQLQNGKTAELGEEHVPAGYYNRIRLMLAAAKVVVDGESFDLEPPQEGIELQYKFQLEGGNGYEMVLDFDAKQSIQKRADGAGYDLDPVVGVQRFQYRYRNCEGEGDCQPQEPSQGECADGACEQSQTGECTEGTCEQSQEPASEGTGECMDGECASGEPASEPQGDPQAEPSPANKQP